MFLPNTIHPMAVHFPIALIVFGFIVEILALFITQERCLPRFGFYLQIVGTLSLLVAWATGYFLTGPNYGESDFLLKNHQLFALLTIGSMVSALAFRLFLMYAKKEDGQLKYLMLSLYLLAFIFVIITGQLGGNMVHGATIIS